MTPGALPKFSLRSLLIATTLLGICFAAVRASPATAVWLAKNFWLGLPAAVIMAGCSYFVRDKVSCLLAAAAGMAVAAAGMEPNLYRDYWSWWDRFFIPFTTTAVPLALGSLFGGAIYVLAHHRSSSRTSD